MTYVGAKDHIHEDICQYPA